MKINTQRIQNINKLNQALQSPTNIQACLSTINREFARFNAPTPVNWNKEDEEVSFILSPNTGKLLVTLYGISEYDLLMNNKNTVIGSIKEMTCAYTIEQVLVGYDVTIKIGFSFKCPLPEDDLLTLRMLGKVKPYFNSGYSSSGENIVCETPNQSPF